MLIGEVEMVNLSIINHLKIAQLEGYNWKRYLVWAVSFRSKKLVGRSKLEWTLRLRLMILIMTLMIVVSWMVSWWEGLIAIALVVLWPAPLVFLTLIISGFGVWIYERIIGMLIKGMLSRKDLMVVAITGSFGKTTTKEILYRLLDRWKYTMRTPKSYNTLLGIYRNLSKELTSKHKYFICELGAFKRGDIRRLAGIIGPNYGLLTGIGKQHLERFGSLEDIVKTKFELLDVVGRENLVVNVGNELVERGLKAVQKKPTTFSTDKEDEADFKLRWVKMHKEGMEFEVQVNGGKYRFKTTLFGSVMLENLLGAIAMASKIGVPMKLLQDEVKYLEYPDNRGKRFVVGRTVVVDNTYSSNEDGFLKTINDFNKLNGKKALITPGLVELGEKTEKVHKNLGRQIARGFEGVYLIGKTERTKAIEEGLRANKFKGIVRYEKSGINPWAVFESIGENYEVILMENDLPDSYY